MPAHEIPRIKMPQNQSNGVKNWNNEFKITRVESIGVSWYKLFLNSVGRRYEKSSWAPDISLGFQAKNGAHGISYQRVGWCIEYQNKLQNKVNLESIFSKENSKYNENPTLCLMTEQKQSFIKLPLYYKSLRYWITRKVHNSPINLVTPLEWISLLNVTGWQDQKEWEGWELHLQIQHSTHFVQR